MRRSLLIFAAALLVSCGYPGEPRPPALMRPQPVTDLTALERGAKIIITFQLPKETTEGVALRSTPEADLRIGIAPKPWNQAVWEDRADRVPVTSDAANTAGKPLVVTAQADAAKYAGHEVVIGVRVTGPKKTDAGWSNLKRLTVAAPLATPSGLRATDAPNATHLQWTDNAPGYRIYRRTHEADPWTQIGESKQSAFNDESVTYGEPMQYRVIAMQGDAESEPSGEVAFTAHDVFPPAVPAGLAAITGIRTIELVWDRDTDVDLAGYRIYRNGTKIADSVVSPSFSDTNVSSGTKYSYQISAYDTAGNESAKSAAAEATME